MDKFVLKYRLESLRSALDKVYKGQAIPRHTLRMLLSKQAFKRFMTTFNKTKKDKCYTSFKDMLEQGYITKSEYNSAQDALLMLRLDAIGRTEPPKYDNTQKEMLRELYKVQGIQSQFFYKSPTLKAQEQILEEEVRRLENKVGEETPLTPMDPALQKRMQELLSMTKV